MVEHKKDKKKEEKEKGYLACLTALALVVLALARTVAFARRFAPVVRRLLRPSMDLLRLD